MTMVVVVIMRIMMTRMIIVIVNQVMDNNFSIGNLLLNNIVLILQKVRPTLNFYNFFKFTNYNDNDFSLRFPLDMQPTGNRPTQYCKKTSSTR